MRSIRRVKLTMHSNWITLSFSIGSTRSSGTYFLGSTVRLPSGRTTVNGLSKNFARSVPVMYAESTHSNLPPIIADNRSTSKGKAISCDEQRLESISSTHDWRPRNECPTVRVKVPKHNEDGNDSKYQVDSVRILL
jgi:hypothetical protein